MPLTGTVYKHVLCSHLCGDVRDPLCSHKASINLCRLLGRSAAGASFIIFVGSFIMAEPFDPI